jgi:hypothetical protein
LDQVNESAAGTTPALDSLATACDMENASSPADRVDLVMSLVESAASDVGAQWSLARALAGLEHWSADDVRSLVDRLPAAAYDPALPHRPVAQVLEAVAGRLQGSARESKSTQAEVDALAIRMVAWYAATPAENSLRAYQLAVLAAGGSPSSLRRLGELIASDPPTDPDAPAIALTPVLGRRQPHLAELFPTLLEGMEHRHWAAAILDVANHAYTVAGLRPHPAAQRVDQLRILLAQLMAALTEVERRPESRVRNSNSAAFVVATVPLCVSLCHALGLIGDKRACAELRSGLEIGHRRIQTEAAGALVQLDDPAGAPALIRLAQMPASRTRALAYAEECGLIDQIDPSYRMPAARAAGDLALWLSVAPEFGLAPAAIELVDQRVMAWPGYHDPQDCYLFRFEYRQLFESGSNPGPWENVGIAGPVVRAVPNPLLELEYSDVYALFAGMQAIHDELFEMPFAQLSQPQKRQVAAGQDDMERKGFREIAPQRVGRFFGDQFVIAWAKRNDHSGYLIWGSGETVWWPDPFGRWNDAIAYAVFKGRKLLAIFNSDDPVGFSDGE